MKGLVKENSEEKEMKEKKTATNPFYTIMHPFDCSYDIRALTETAAIRQTRTAKA